MDDSIRQNSEAEKFLHERIPLTRAMGLQVISDDHGGFAVEAPVALNSNHLGTAFGGSINAVATLAAYGWLWLASRDAAADVVIRDSTIRFLRPIRETIRARCASPAVEEWEEFQRALRSKGKARITLHVQVEEQGQLAAELTGTFVALRQDIHNTAAETTPKKEALAE